MLGKCLIKPWLIGLKNRRKERKHVENMLKMRGLVKTKETIRWSDGINETLFGEFH